MTTPVEAKSITVEEFEAFVDLPENADRNFEFIGGEIVEVPSNPSASTTGSRFSGFFFIYLLKNDIAHLTGEAGGYMVSGERYAPDVGILLKAKQAKMAQRGYNPLLPDLAVEVDFPSTTKSQPELRIKLANYLAAGTTVWMAYPDTKRVEVYVPGKPVLILGMTDVLDGGDILPGFKLPVKDVFPE